MVEASYHSKLKIEVSDLNKKIGWAVLGPGGIANRFMKGFSQVSDARLVAVASRSKERGETFTKRYGGKAYMDYAEAIMDKEVDIVYVATPHTFHMEHTLLALDLGKPVLCEKPLAPNAAQAQKMAAKAKEKDLFLMEGIWSRFFPAINQVREWLDAGEIGEIHHVTADFGFAAKEDPTSRLFAPDLAGGSLLDVGIYTIAFASMVFKQKPNRIAGLADFASTGVDLRMGCVLGYNDGGLATLFSSISTNTPQEGIIVGSKGHIRIPKFWSPSTAILYKNGVSTKEYKANFEGEGFQFEIIAVQEDLRKGRIENQFLPLSESITIVETMDALREQWKLVYPFEV